MTTMVRIDDELHVELRRRSAYTGVSITQLVTDALRACYLDGIAGVRPDAVGMPLRLARERDRKRDGSCEHH